MRTERDKGDGRTARPYPGRNDKGRRGTILVPLRSNVRNARENFSYTQSYMFSDKVEEVTKKLYIFVTQINHELYLDRNGFKLHLDCIFLLAFVVALVKLVF